MVQNVLIKILLAPLSLLYGLGVSLRNFFYKRGILKGVEFSLPVISVGNLSIGGTGKTPHIEYLIGLLKDYINVATLSRGYRRKTRGYLVVKPQFSAADAGDEPLQFARKFPDILVTVGEDRSYAIPRLLQEHPETQVILLDDAFQHLSVRPGLNILLTEYSQPYTRDYLLPSGRLREWRSAAGRADIIVVTKCPENLDEAQRQSLLKELSPLPRQPVFFTCYGYHQPYYIFNQQQTAPLQQDWDVLLVCAIAGAQYLVDYLEPRVRSIEVMEFEDHHFFSNYDTARMKALFDEINSSKKIILTTEKDAMRLELHRSYLLQNRLPVFALPVEVQFLFEQREVFDTHVKNFLLNFKA